jgi:hypothetical protein
VVAIATAFVRLRPDPDRAAFVVAGKAMGDQAGAAAGKSMGSRILTEARTGLRSGGADLAKDGETIGANVGRGMSRGIGTNTRKATGDTSAFGNALALTAARATLFGTTMAAALPSVIHLTAAVAPAAGAAVALPAALLAGAAAMSTFRVATAGVSKAITTGLTGTAKQAKAELDKLPPSARAFAQSIIALKPQIDALRASVAQRFFAPLTDEIAPLTRTLFPLLRTQMGGVATALGGLGEELAQSARSAETFGAVRAIFTSTRLSLNNLRDAVFPVTAAMSSLITATAPFLPALASGFANLAQRVAVFVDTAAQSGRISAAFQAAMATLRDLGGIALNVGSILGSVFRAASVGSGSLLGNLRALTGQVAAFLRSGQGSAALTTVFSTLATLGNALRTSLAAVLPAIARSLAIIGPVLAGLAGPAAQLVVALAPLLPYFTSLAAVVLRAVTPAIAALTGWLAQNGTLLKVVASALAAGIAAFRIIAVVTRLWAAAQVVLNIALTANPIGIVVVALAALVAGLIVAYRNSETFRNFVNKLGASIAVAWGQLRAVIGAVSSWFTGTIIPSIRTAINQGAAAFRFLENIVSIVFRGISIYVRTYIATVMAIFNAVKSFVTVTLPNAFRFLVNSVRTSIAGWRLVISTGWNFVRGLFTQLRTFLVVTLVAAFRAFATIVRTIWNTWASGIRAIWNSIRTGSFEPLRRFITQTLPGAFRSGVGAIRAAWDRVREAARTPVAFVVNRVINPLIGGYNRIAGVFHAPTANPIRGFARGGMPTPGRGGKLPGPAVNQDNMLAMAPNGPLAVMSREFLINAKSTMANLPLVAAINAKRGKVNREDVDPYLDGAARGGLIGRDGIGDGIGDFFSRIWNSVKGTVTAVGNAVLHPLETLKRVAGALLGRIPGAGPFVTALRGMGTNVINGIGNWLKNNAAGAGLGTAGVNGGWRTMQRLISARFPFLHMISGFRPGARTLSGNQSYHALGRAVDYPAYRPLAAWIKSTYGARTKELITPWQELNLHNGRPHHYTGAVWNQHNFAGGNAHVHWAARYGGLISDASGMPLRLFDTGGAWPSGTLGANLSGKTEYVSTERGGGDIHIHLHNSIIASERQFEGMTRNAVKKLKRDGQLP